MAHQTREKCQHTADGSPPAMISCGVRWGTARRSGKRSSRGVGAGSDLGEGSSQDRRTPNLITITNRDGAGATWNPDRRHDLKSGCESA